VDPIPIEEVDAELTSDESTPPFNQEPNGNQGSRADPTIEKRTPRLPSRLFFFFFHNLLFHLKGQSIRKNFVCRSPADVAGTHRQKFWDLSEYVRIQSLPNDLNSVFRTQDLD
jgi:hypothetical protein